MQNTLLSAPMHQCYKLKLYMRIVLYDSIYLCIISIGTNLYFEVPGNSQFEYACEGKI